ncbi:MAG: hypothetical protein OEZ68_21600 [Gammaproteobacteria bacterium]|nr:hypothetical protein [Gammaproteobacteria bacterium]MDH5803395.1 hypothetical protein [Gammaproteobacteria bacterium]
MGNNISELKTDGQLLDALKKSSQVKLGPVEILEQRVSFVYGSMSSDSNVTREHIKQVISEQEGIKA